MNAAGLLSERVAQIVGSRDVSMAERALIGEALDEAGSWDDLPDPVRALLADIQSRPEWVPDGGVMDHQTVVVASSLDPGLIDLPLDTAHTDHNFREYWVHGKGALKIRWGTHGDFMRCVHHLEKYAKGGAAFDPKGLCNEYHREALGVAPGQEKLHTDLSTEVDVPPGGPVLQPQLMAEPDMPEVVPAAEPCDDCGDTPVDVPDWLPGEMWHAVYHIEGVSTGQRVWLPGSITWREPPFALHWEYSTAAHGGQMMTVHVGMVTRAARIGNKLNAWGNLDLGAPDGLEVGRKLATGFARGVSMGPGREGEGPGAIMYDVVWPAGTTPDGFQQGQPEQVVFTSYPVGELTVVSVPAQEGAYIEPSPELVARMTGMDTPVMIAAGGPSLCTCAGQDGMPPHKGRCRGQGAAQAQAEAEQRRQAALAKAAERMKYEPEKAPGTTARAKLANARKVIGDDRTKWTSTQRRQMKQLTMQAQREGTNGSALGKELRKMKQGQGNLGLVGGTALATALATLPSLCTCMGEDGLPPHPGRCRGSGKGGKGKSFGGGEAKALGKALMEHVNRAEKPKKSALAKAASKVGGREGDKKQIETFGKALLREALIKEPGGKKPGGALAKAAPVKSARNMSAQEKLDNAFKIAGKDPAKWTPAQRRQILKLTKEAQIEGNKPGALAKAISAEDTTGGGSKALKSLDADALTRKLKSIMGDKDSGGFTSKDVEDALAGRSVADLKKIAADLPDTVSKQGKTRQQIIGNIARGTVGFRETTRAIRGNREADAQKERDRTQAVAKAINKPVAAPAGKGGNLRAAVERAGVARPKRGAGPLAGKSPQELGAYADTLIAGRNAASNQEIEDLRDALSGLSKDEVRQALAAHDAATAKRIGKPFDSRPLASASKKSLIDRIVAGAKKRQDSEAIGETVRGMQAQQRRLFEGRPTTASAVRVHDTATSDNPWDKGVNEGRLDSPMSLNTARNFYAWIDDSQVTDGKLPKAAGKFPHHFVDADGTPGAASTAACSNGLARLKGATDIPADQRQAVYNHLRQHLIDSGRDEKSIPPLHTMITTASGSWIIEVPDLPSVTAFEKPDVPPGTPPTITDDGRFFGYFAPANIGHRSFARMGQRKVVSSLGRTDYSRYLKPIRTAEGETVLAGPVTMECPHAPTQGYGELDRRHQFYEDTCSIVARVAVGEDPDGGRWFSGVLEHGVTAEQISKLTMCHLSLDSQPHPDRPGWQDFVAILAVPTGGWPTSVDTAQVVHRVQEFDDGTALVTASSAPIVFAQPAHGPAVIDRSVMYSIARTVGMDPASIIDRELRKLSVLGGVHA